MNRLIVALCLLLCGCATNPIDTDYRGADAGVLVFSAGYIQTPMNMDFFYRRVGTKGDHINGGDGRIHYNASLLMRTPLDYDGKESGAVRISHLPPGEYEVYTWEISTYGPVADTDYGPQSDFSLRFSIKPGQATYIGTYELLSVSARYPDPSFKFLVADRQERDLAIARKKDPKLPPVTIAVPDVAGIPSLVAAAP